jgi:hypothetical protein
MLLTIGFIIGGVIIGSMNYDKCKCYIKEATITFIMKARSGNLN